MDNENKMEKELEKEDSTRESLVDEARACEQAPVQTKKKMKKPLKILLIVLAVLLSLLLIAVGAAYGIFKYYYGMLDYEELFSGETWETTPADILNQDKGENIEDIDPSLVATPDEMDMYLDQINGVDDSNSGFDVQYDQIGGSLGKIERNYSADYISASDNVINILLIGTDSRRNTTSGLSDVMMVVSICPSTKSIVLTSFLRDIYVSIPGHSGNRLNTAYAMGGPSLLVETIEKNFGLRIDRYAMVNFYTFVDVVDCIGNVSIYLTDAELSVINLHINENNRIVNNNNDKTADAIENKGAGYYDLNGIQALGYARIRKVDNDFGRTNRQRNVISAIIDKVKTLSPSEWNTLLNKMLPYIKTNLTEGDLLSMIINAGSYMKYQIKSISVPAPGSFKYMNIDGRSVIGVDLTKVREHLKSNIYA